MKKIFSVRSFLVTLGFYFVTALLIANFQTEAQAAIDTWQKGLTLRLTNETPAEVDASLLQAKESGANFITITPGYLTDSVFSSNVDRKDRTPSDEILIYAFDKAHDLGMKAMLKPHLDIIGGRWRANLEPENIPEFFINYSAMMMHYAVLAEANNIEILSVGAELYKITANPETEPYWRDLISDIRDVYSGELTYSANANSLFYDEGTAIQFWDVLDYVGLSLYVEVADNTTPTVASIMAEWAEVDTSYVRPLVLKTGKPVVITEIGYRSIDGAGMSPENYTMTAPVDLQEQVDLYKAFFEYWKNTEYIHGVHWWDWKVDVNAGGPDDRDYTVQNKPAQEVLTYYFTNAVSGDLPPVDIEETPVEDPSVYSLISNINTTSGNLYTVFRLSEGKKMYHDRDYEVTSMPEVLIDEAYIRTFNGDKYVSNTDFLSFELNDPAKVIVAYDSRATTLPDWLSGWQDTGLDVGTTDVSFNLYVKAFDAGSISLGGNSAIGMTGAESNYFVIVTTKEVPMDLVTIPDPVIQDPDPVEPPIEEPSDDPLPVEEHTIIVNSPDDGALMSGEKKIKIYLTNLDYYDYIATYEVDGRGEQFMSYGSGNTFKEAKIQFNKWNWNGSGPYNVVIRAKDTNNTLLAQTTLSLFIRQ